MNLSEPFTKRRCSRKWQRRKPLFPPPLDEKTGRRKRDKGQQAKHVLTVNGRIRIVRRWWYSLEEGSLAPADVLIDTQQQSISCGVREMACRLNNDGPSFDKTAENLARTAQIQMSGEQLRKLVVEEGQAVLRAQQACRISPAFQAADCVVDSRSGKGLTRIYAGVDGVMVPIITDAEKQLRRKTIREKRKRGGKKCRPLPPRKMGANLPFKEFKVGVFYDETGKHWHEVLSRGKRHSVGALMRREAKRLAFKLADERVAIVDGASWIRMQLEEQPWGLNGLGLDFYHLSENIHRCRRAIYGEQDATGVAWAGDLLHTFKHAGYATAWDKLADWRRSLNSPRKKQAADRLLNYVSERRDMISFPEFRAKGWQIGSGPTESRCKTSTYRLKGRGRRWNHRNAEAVAALTTLHDSNQWQVYWQTPVPCGT
ncbi:MAG: UPF0236 family protein [Planctomycetales bacterium]|nr:UPF0236 family protein [Planctomycetales bacterium]